MPSEDDTWSDLRRRGLARPLAKQDGAWEDAHSTIGNNLLSAFAGWPRVRLKGMPKFPLRVEYSLPSEDKEHIAPLTYHNEIPFAAMKAREDEWYIQRIHKQGQRDHEIPPFRQGTQAAMQHKQMNGHISPVAASSHTARHQTAPLEPDSRDTARRQERWSQLSRLC